MLFRMIVAFWYVAYAMYKLIDSKCTDLKYLTFWGILLTAITFTSLTIARLRHHIFKGELKLTEPHHFFTLEKFCIFIFGMTMAFEFLITIMYWTVLYDWDGYSRSIDAFLDIIGHALPLIVLIIDFIFNRIPFFPKHLVLMLIISVIYAIVNMAVTLGSGTPVYSVMTWKDGWTALYMFASCLALLFGFFMFYYISLWKNKKYDKLT